MWNRVRHKVLKTWLKTYYLKPRKYSYKGASVWVHKDVFTPYLTISTNFFVDFIEGLELIEKKVLELGCGSGLISVFCAQRGANVLATDINNTALQYLKKSSSEQHMEIEIHHSNLFESIENQVFDYIFINPPYYPRIANNIVEKAWFCGENFEYFEDLFMQLPSFLNSQTYCYMILSDACNFEAIEQIARKHGVVISKVKTFKNKREENYIFRLTQILSN